MHQQCAKAHHRMQVAGGVDRPLPRRCLAERNQQITGAGHNLPSVHLCESGWPRARIQLRPLAANCADATASHSAHATQC
jgi:hypothetical protein